MKKQKNKKKTRIGFMHSCTSTYFSQLLRFLSVIIEQTD